MSAQAEWYYIWAGRAHGPVTWGAFEALLAEGIKPDRVTLARSGDDRWMTPDEAREAERMGSPAGTFGLPPTTGTAARPRPANVLDGFGYWLSLGWEMLMADVWAFVLAVLLMVLVAMVTMGILAPPLGMGLILMGLRVYDGRPVRAADVFSGLSLFFPAWGLNIVLGLVMFLPLMLVIGAGAGIGYAAGGTEGIAVGAMIAWVVCFLPWFLLVYFATIACLFCQGLIAERRAGVIESIGMSWNAVRPQFWGYLVVQLVLGMINGAGTQACYIGMFITMPYIMLVLVTLYRDKFPARPNATP